jgi:hypothetical protein
VDELEFELNRYRQEYGTLKEQNTRLKEKIMKALQVMNMCAFGEANDQ